MSFPVSAFFPTAEDAAICGDTCGSTQENAGTAAAAGNGRPTCGCKRQ
jgi:hypothetical protein